MAAILLGDVKVPAGGRGGRARWNGTPHAAPMCWSSRRASGRRACCAAGPTARRATGQGALRPLCDIVGASAAQQGRRLWQAAYEELEEAAPEHPTGLRLPSLIKFAEKDASFDDGVEIKVKDRTLNPTLRPEDFTITPPAGTRVIDVGCGP